jgi:hypothetical protein
MLVSQFGLWTSWPRALQRAGSHIQNGTRIAACQKQSSSVHGEMRNQKEAKKSFPKISEVSSMITIWLSFAQKNLCVSCPVQFVLACWGGDGPSAVLRADCGEPEETIHKDERRSETSMLSAMPWRLWRLWQTSSLTDVFNAFNVFQGYAGYAGYALTFLPITLCSNTFTSSVQKWGGGVARPWPGFTKIQRYGAMFQRVSTCLWSVVICRTYV